MIWNLIKNFCEKILGPKQFVIQKNLWSKKDYGPKNFLSTKLFGPEFWVNLGSKILFGPNKFRVQNIWVQKSVGSKTIPEP